MVRATSPLIPRPARFSSRKARELVLYICARSMEHRGPDAVRLNRTLFACDFRSYRSHARSITGGIYLAEKSGPFMQQWPSVRDALLREQALHQVTFASQPSGFVTLRAADLETFTATEMSVVEQALAALGRGEDDAEHAEVFLPWRACHAESLARGGAPVAIPYRLALVSNRQPDSFESAHLLALAEQRGWGA